MLWSKQHQLLAGGRPGAIPAACFGDIGREKETPMNSTTDPKAIEPDDALAARADERLVHAYDQIARADKQLARLTEQLSKLERDAAYRPSAVVGNRPPRGRPALRGFIGLLLAVCIVVGAFVSRSSYGDAAKLIAAQWVQQPILTSWLPIDKPVVPAQPNPSAVQVAAATAVLPLPTPSAQTVAQDAAPTTVPISPELAPLLQTMARDLANVQQGIAELKANQEQTARENAKATEQLRASQEQMTRLIAKASEQNKISEQNLRPTSAPPLRPIATPTRKPVPTQQSPQARARPQAPTQLQPNDQ
jgi:uncharacterized membrane protein YccC